MWDWFVKLYRDTTDYPSCHIHPDIRREVELLPNFHFIAKETCPHCHWSHTRDAEESAWN